MKAFRDIRILPVVLVAVLGLAILKIAGLVIDGGYCGMEVTSVVAFEDGAPEVLREGVGDVSAFR
mgnify:CR=1 FL=1